MLVMGIDAATTTGWALGYPTGRPTLYGAFTLPGMGIADRHISFAAAYSAVRSLVSEHKPEIVAIEHPYQARGKAAHTGVSLLMLSGAVQAGAINGGAKRVTLVHPSSWRSVVLKKGFPKNPKRAIMNYCRDTFEIDLTDDNIGDAIGVMLWQHAQERLM